MDLVKISTVGGTAFMAALVLVSTGASGRAEQTHLELYPATSPMRIQKRIDDAFRTSEPVSTHPLSGLTLGPIESEPLLPNAQPNPHSTPISPIVDRWSPIIDEAAQRFGIPADWVRGVMHKESAGRTHLNGYPITSSAGAMGLMQVMPATFAELRARYGLGPDPHDPRTNIMAGTAYLREMYDRFGSRYFLAAYNAGPARVDDHLRTGRPLPYETLDYTATLMPALVPNAVAASAPMSSRVQDLTSAEALRAVASAPSRPADRRPANPSAASVFVASPATVSAVSREDEQPRDSLFVTLSAADRRQSARADDIAED